MDLQQYLDKYIDNLPFVNKSLSLIINHSKNLKADWGKFRSSATLLDIGSTSLESFEGIESLENLTIIYATCSNLKSLEGLNKSKSLKTIILIIESGFMFKFKGFEDYSNSYDLNKYILSMVINRKINYLQIIIVNSSLQRRSFSYIGEDIIYYYLKYNLKPLLLKIKIKLLWLRFFYQKLNINQDSRYTLICKDEFSYQ